MDDFYSTRGLRKNPSSNANANQERQQRPPAPNPNGILDKPNQQQRSTNMDDQYMAEILQRYGDADEAARRQWSQFQQTHQQPQAYFETDVSTSSIKSTSTFAVFIKQTIVHEKQQLLRCGVHALNNLFQTRQLFTHEDLDGIVYEFDRRYANNDYGTTWVGDYDLRILIEAINRKGHPVRQINYRNGEPLQQLPWDTYFGLLMNINGAHWFTIKRINGVYYNLDSTFARPSRLGPKEALVKYLIYLIENFKDVYIFVVSSRTHGS